MKRPSWRRLLGPAATGAVLAATAAWAAVQPEEGIGLPRDASVDGHNIDFLINVTHVFNIILFVIMCAWMGIACVKHNSHHEAQYDHGNSKRSVTIALSLSAIIFAVVDGNLFVNTMRYLNAAFWDFHTPLSDPNTVKVEVNAHQWAWDFRYAGPDGKFGTDDDIVTWNELHVPKDRPVYLQLQSTDVIHSFYLPNFRTKQDVVPGMTNFLWFQAKDAGEFDIGCAQHCGTHHYKMKGHLTVTEEGDFKQWMAQAGQNSKNQYDPEDKDAHWGWDWKEHD
jgi:cytochrome c oxidase subunit 2